MKMLLLISILCAVLLGCSLTSSNDQVEKFIPGTYIRFSSHEYGKGYDTLVITLQNETANQYKILRKWNYYRILDGEQLEPDYKQQTTTAIYHRADKVLQDEQSGSLYSFDVKEKVLFNGHIKYKKL